MDKDHCELFYLIVKAFKDTRGKNKGLKLRQMKSLLDALRQKEKDQPATTDVMRTWLQDLKEDDWIICDGKFWKVHPAEALPKIVIDREQALVLDTIVKLAKEKGKDGKDGFTISELEKKLYSDYPKLKEVLDRKQLEKTVKKLLNSPYIERKIETGEYHLIRDSYHPEAKYGEKYYIDLILKYNFKGI